MKTRTPSRERILKAAASLFRKQGFHGTSIREIAHGARVSLGNIYNHFDNKEDIFSTLLSQYERAYFGPEQPLLKAFAASPFPQNIEAIGTATRDTVEKYSEYLPLIYVDVVEFDARHIYRMFQGMRQRYLRTLGSTRALAKDIDPAAALMMVTWSYFNYFTVEKLFGVKTHYGMTDDEVIRFFGRVFRNGILQS